MINRYDLVRRHHPNLRDLDTNSPFSVGNGEFAFTVDITGLQTFTKEYDSAIPLCTMSNWGWHTHPLPEGVSLNDIKPKMFDVGNRKVGYFVSSKEQEQIYYWLRENPHRFNLGQIGLKIINSNGSEVNIDDIENINQTLDLWTGTIYSNFSVENIPIAVKVCCHPKKDTIAVSVSSKLIGLGRILIKYKFPFASFDKNGSDWIQAEKHHTEMINHTETSIGWVRVLDNDRYFVHAEFDNKIYFKKEESHYYTIGALEGDSINFTASFSPSLLRDDAPTTCENVFIKSQEYWSDFWTGGGAIELYESADPRAFELERRIVLSQYLTAIQSSGSIPPQESGLTCNSWHGKAHLEMHWWHAVHFALWGRQDLLKNSMWWYKSIMHKCRETAKRQGYKGVRWHKMVAPNGDDSPSEVGPFLLWQQPHPIYYAELLYLIEPTKTTIEAFEEIVFETAEFLESFVAYEDGRYILSQPLIPAQENHQPLDVLNPTFELEYVHFALSIAQKWRERIGLSRNEKWDDIISNISSLPTHNGVYIAHEQCLDTFEKFNKDHPSMLMAMGFLPGNLADESIMRNTLDKILNNGWHLEKTWGWDFPVMAMTAARIGQPEIAIDCLLMECPKNTYLTNGHNFQTPRLPLYLPGNGGLLSAVAMMAAGWEGSSQKNAPGFPKNGKWVVQYEGLNQYM